MKIAYTVCSVSHLGKALVMANSFKKHNPAYEIIIGIIDRIDGRIEEELLKKYTFIEIEKLGIDYLPSLCEKYDGLEMSCLAKPHFAEYVFAQNPDLQQLIYIDGDIKVYNSFASVEEKLIEYDIFLTPHIFTSYTDDRYPRETFFLNSGIYNAGFFGLRRSENTFRFLEWWKNQLADYGYNRMLEGMFVDQLWLNFVPLYFEKVYLSKEYGLNMAYWNLHERHLSKNADNEWIVNNEHPLIFFHYSGFLINDLNAISAHNDRFRLSNRPDLVELFEDYKADLLAHNHDKYDAEPNRIIQTPKYLKYPPKVRDFLLRIARKIIRELHG